ncbi:ABC-F family ATP-binding cassette domain-containing protein [Entomospira nematocerorum]|uniref:ABC-F family ATP-binding cassette domain-containing protein n=1 Tax=Entomospira nematocerorum TaxID=2719987 RepID=A0A968GHB7_9SPIO|nr:ABC-F family ATP-binding cassette domain-containing protein [Entomospira nematocera]NIZ47151.1 ABC-F family ATP-binding cassette domain-containing protein [Entomospira nematocera]WDI34306.1 ABC-F family ATP-binding cassette domain-containing protein [Entomospira nematocera]
MAFLQASNLSLAFGSRIILDNVALSLGPMTKAALVGINGAGKSTLMKVIAGKLTSDDGAIVLSKDARLSYMAQSSKVDAEKTLFEQVETAFQYWFNLEARSKELMASGNEIQLQEASDLQDQIMHSSFYQREALIDTTLRGLGFSPNDFTKQVKHFSSGWQMRIALAQVLLEESDILLLDEPSNFLDTETSLWLIGWLKRYTGGLLIVSHDRYFLDQVTEETLELFNGQLKRYVGSYSQYEKKHEEEMIQLFKLREQLEDRLAQIEDFARRFRASPSKASLVQSRLREAEKIREQLPSLPESIKQMRIRLPKPPHAGERVLYMEDLAKSYGDRVIFKELTLLIDREERIAISGVNGAGKSTLLRILSGKEKADTGYLKSGSGVEIGYFSEETHEPFIGKTVLEEMEAQAPLHLQPEIRNILGAFLFTGDSVYKAITVLSGGEKARLLLARLFLRSFNLLILDEPTNHLDLQSKELLLQALKEYKGTILFVSHDRYFNEQLATSVLHMQEYPLFYPGDYFYYLEQWTKGSQGKLLRSPERLNNEDYQKKTEKKVIPTTQQERIQNKAEQARIRKLKREEEQLLQEIHESEVELDRLHCLLGEEHIYRNVSAMKETQVAYATVEKKIEQLYNTWQEIHEELL